MEHFYQLSALKDGVTLQSGIRDCMTKEPLKAGSRIVVCSKCRLAGIYLAENWSGSCVFCQGTETMEFPQGMDAVFHAHHSSSAGGYDAKPEAKDEKPRSKDEKSAPSPDEKKPKNGSSETDPRRRISPRTMMIGGGVLLAVLLILALIIRGCSQSEEPADTGAASFHQREVNSSEAESTTEASSRAAESSESSVLETAPLTDAAAVAAKSGDAYLAVYDADYAYNYDGTENSPLCYGATVVSIGEDGKYTVGVRCDTVGCAEKMGGEGRGNGISMISIATKNGKTYLPFTRITVNEIRVDGTPIYTGNSLLSIAYADNGSDVYYYIANIYAKDTILKSSDFGAWTSIEVDFTTDSSAFSETTTAPAAVTLPSDTQPALEKTVLTVPAIEEKSVNAAPAEIITYSGSMKTEGQVDSYQFTPKYDKRYRFEISGITNGTSNSVKLYIYNSGGGLEDSTGYSIANGGGLTMKDLKAGETYTVKVKQYSGYDNYQLNIGCQPPTVEVSGITKINDSMCFTDQVNRYTYTPTVSGKYRFEFSGLTNGTSHSVKLYIYNSGDGLEASTGYSVANGDGLTLNLTAGELYRIHVVQYSGFDNYTLNIGAQKAPRDITGYTEVADSIEFTDQSNVYTFTSPRSGKYRFELTGLTRGTSHSMKLRLNNAGGGKEAATDYSIGSGDGLSVTLKEGETYTLYANYYSGFDEYIIQIGYQTAAVDITQSMQAQGEITFTDQMNNYYFTPSVTGNYRFSISGMTNGTSYTVDLIVYNSGGGKEARASNGLHNGYLDVKDLQAGEQYEIVVFYRYGKDSYVLRCDRIT